MQLDKNSLNKLLAANDKQLWQFVRMIAASSGVELPAEISPEDMKKLREGVSLASDSGIDTETAASYLKDLGVNGIPGGK